MSGGETMTFVGFAHRGVPADRHRTTARRGRRVRRPRLVGAFGGTGRYARAPGAPPGRGLGPRLLRAAGEPADGAVLWMAPVRASPAEAAIVGSETSVRTQLQGLIAGATDIWAAVFAVGDDNAHPCGAPPIYYESCCPEQFPKEAHVVTASTITPTVGLEASGMTAAQLDTREAAEDARRALDQHGVVVYREVNISDEGLLAFSRRLGTLVVQRRPRHVGQHRDVAPRLAL